MQEEPRDSVALEPGAITQSVDESQTGSIDASGNEDEAAESTKPEEREQDETTGDQTEMSASEEDSKKQDPVKEHPIHETDDDEGYSLDEATGHDDIADEEEKSSDAEDQPCPDSDDTPQAMEGVGLVQKEEQEVGIVQEDPAEKVEENKTENPVEEVEEIKTEDPAEKVEEDEADEDENQLPER